MEISDKFAADKRALVVRLSENKWLIATSGLRETGYFNVVGECVSPQMASRTMDLYGPPWSGQYHRIVKVSERQWLVVYPIPDTRYFVMMAKFNTQWAAQEVLQRLDPPEKSAVREAN